MVATVPRKLQVQALSNHDSTVEQIKIVKGKISDMLKEKFEDAKIRSRVKYLDIE